MGVSEGGHTTAIRPHLSQIYGVELPLWEIEILSGASRIYGFELHLCCVKRLKLYGAELPFSYCPVSQVYDVE
jgi:hypothetical protein